jgi:hypothetical protein
VQCPDGSRWEAEDVHRMDGVAQVGQQDVAPAVRAQVLVWAALITIGRVPTAKMTVAIVPATAGTPMSMVEASPDGTRRRIGAIMQLRAFYVRGCTTSCS